MYKIDHFIYKICSFYAVYVHYFTQTVISIMSLHTHTQVFLHVVAYFRVSMHV